MESRHGLHTLAFNYSRAFLRKRKSNESAVPISFFALAVRWPAHKDLATGGADEVGNRKTVVPDPDKWGARFEELVQLTALLER